MLKEFTPLRACIRYWPSFLGDANFLDDAGLTEYDTEINDQRFYISGFELINETELKIVTPKLSTGTYIMTLIITVRKDASLNSGYELESNGIEFSVQ